MRRLETLNRHLLLQGKPTLFKGPINDTKWDYDPSESQMNLEEAQRLYRMSIPKEEAQILDIFQSN
jgi:hypothetical protein